MQKHVLIADRKMSKCTGSDPYIELKSTENFKNIWALIDSEKINTINGDDINRTKNPLFEFMLVDNFTKKKYSSNISKLSKSIRFRIGDYSDAIGLLPSQIIYITMHIENDDCKLGIKAESFYKYILKKVSVTENIYFLEEENCSKMTVPDDLLENLKVFDISYNGNTRTIGKSGVSYPVYELDGCTTSYIGVPFNEDLELDCFNEIEEIL